MRHGNRNNALSRTASHRSAMLSNMACSLIEHKRINTTVAKAKVLRQFVEPLITKSKTDSTHSRRLVFSNLKNKAAVTELFREVAPKIANREGGYTRIIKLGNRLGDAAEMCMIELVDFNELMLEEAKSKTRRSRRGKKKSSADSAPKSTAEAADKSAATEEEIKPEAKAAEANPEAETKVDEPKEPKAEDAKEAKAEDPKTAKADDAEDTKKAEEAKEAKAKKDPDVKKDETPEAKNKDTDEKDTK